ncbi:hypothetical protein EV426DRAFT_706527 [Tirmania nivea]|nr:hypothetical protein EV426DRAFT_706527 [Tirmania nivea]
MTAGALAVKKAIEAAFAMCWEEIPDDQPVESMPRRVQAVVEADHHQLDHHITFDCPHHRQQRQELIRDARTWEDLDKPIWRKEEGEEEEWDAVEAYFAYLYRPLAGR